MRLEAYFREHLGEVLDNGTLRRIAGGSDSWTRRLRELREPRHGGWAIESHVDSDDLRPGEYRIPHLPEPNDGDSAPRVSGRLRAEVLHRDGYSCRLCGASAHDVSLVTGRRVRLQVDHIKGDSHQGKPTADNLQTTCTDCNHGRSNLAAPQQSVSELMAHVRRAGRAEQHAVYEWLRSRFRD